MSDKQQTPTPSTNNVRRSLILVIAAVVVGTLWFVFQSKDKTDQALNNTKKAAASDTADKTDEYAGWKSYTWTSEGLTLKHPGDWVTSETTSMGRLYAKNSEVDLLKEETPANFQQIWLSVDTDETSATREAAIKAGTSTYREVGGKVTASTVKAGNLTINIYEYQTLGGPTLEAYWTNKAGKRFFATNSTEVGQQNQTDMVANLKKILATITFAE